MCDLTPGTEQLLLLNLSLRSLQKSAPEIICFCNFIIQGNARFLYKTFKT